MSVKPDRIGHGTFLPPSVGGTQEIVDMIAQQKIPIGAHIVRGNKSLEITMMVDWLTNK